jgi:hypothetical protein
MTVIIFRTRDNLWHLQSYDQKSQQVYMLLTFTRYILALEAATLLQMHVDYNETLSNSFNKATM